MYPEIVGRKYGDYLGFIRRAMIKEQLEARGVRDPRVLAAMDKVWRHSFAPEDLVTRSYEDYPLPIGRGQTMPSAYAVALTSRMLELKGTERVLEIGTGSGYQTAVLAELAAKVFTVEIFPDLAGAARARLEKLGYSTISYRTGDGARGWPEEGPFDAIISTCAVPEIPPALKAQLAPGGRLLFPAGGAEQKLLLLRRTDAGFEEGTGPAVSFRRMLGGGGPVS